MRVLTIEEIYQHESQYIFIDVRSPSEYQNSTIPGAINIPVLLDAERVHVGTVYQAAGVIAANELGFQYIGKRLAIIYEQLLSLRSHNKTFVFFCARGQTRSNAIVGLFSQFKINCVKLHHGYKGYRRHINNELPKLIAKKQFITLYSNTGTGKTNLLKQLHTRGYDVLDLEGCANHRGSMFGHLGLGKQHSLKMFESLVFDSLRTARSNLVFCEGESRNIGYLTIPKTLFMKVNQGFLVYLETDLAIRVNNIKNEYLQASITKQDYSLVINKLRKYISNEQVELLLSYLDDNKIELLIKELLVNYYDKNYKQKRYNFTNILKFNDNEVALTKLINIYNNLKEE